MQAGTSMPLAGGGGNLPTNLWKCKPVEHSIQVMRFQRFVPIRCSIYRDTGMLIDTAAWNIWHHEVNMWPSHWPDSRVKTWRFVLLCTCSRSVCWTHYYIYVLPLSTTFTTNTSLPLMYSCGMFLGVLLGEKKDLYVAAAAPKHLWKNIHLAPYHLERGQRREATNYSKHYICG